MDFPLQKPTKINSQTRYHLLFATSMLLYNSLEYFTIGHIEMQNSPSLLTLINSVNPILLQAASILGTFLIISSHLFHTNGFFASNSYRKRLKLYDWNQLEINISVPSLRFN